MCSIYFPLCSDVYRTPIFSFVRKECWSYKVTYSQGNSFFGPFYWDFQTLWFIDYWESIGWSRLGTCLFITLFAAQVMTLSFIVVAIIKAEPFWIFLSAISSLGTYFCIWFLDQTERSLGSGPQFVFNFVYLSWVMFAGIFVLSELSGRGRQLS